MNRQEYAQAFQQVMEQHANIFHKVARTYCPNEEDRQDLLQEISVQVWRALPKYDERCRMSTFLYRIALNVAISFWRKTSRHANRYSPLGNQAHHVPASEPSHSDWKFTLLERFIAALKETDKALMILYLEDKSHKEISEIMGLSVSNVGTRIGRIKEKLKTQFSQHNPNDHD